jgi:hypothetical protein
MTNKQRQIQCLYDWIKDRNIKQKNENEKNTNDPDAFSTDSKFVQEKQNAA